MHLKNSCLSEGKVNHIFIGKSCSKLVITLGTINNYQFFFSVTNGCILEKMNIVKKTHLSNTHFPDVVNHLCLGKSKFARCSLNDAEVLIKEVRQFQVGLPLPAPIAIIISLINQSHLPVKDLRFFARAKNKK